MKRGNWITLLAWLGLAAAPALPAAELGSSFPPGTGSRFQLTAGGMVSTLVIAITDYSGSRLGIEYYFSSGSSMVPLEMWQQFVFEIPAQGAVQVREGYVYTKDLKSPERMPAEYLKGFTAVDLDQFLFSNQNQIDAARVGKETIQVPAGKIEATHYRRVKDGQTVDFWVADGVKPIGTVKLVSNGKKPEQKYEMVLEALLTNLKPKIDRSAAQPLSATGKALLATPTL